jgi:hypothetical protein
MGLDGRIIALSEDWHKGRDAENCLRSSAVREKADNLKTAQGVDG